jgi:ABC-type proline/glycine betaine transport system ATPase subunit
MTQLGTARRSLASSGVSAHQLSGGMKQRGGIALIGSPADPRVHLFARMFS